MLKDIVVNLSTDISRDVAAEFAVSVAAYFEAHLTGIVFTYAPTLPAAYGAALPSEFIDKLWAQSKRRATASIDLFNKAAQRAGVLSETHLQESSIARASSLFAQIARRFDASIVRQLETDHAAMSNATIEAVLFESGRPVLIVPYIQKDGIKLNRVLVCWDGSRAAARAVADALPIITRAGTIEVLTITIDGEHARSADRSGVDIAEHLARHGLKVGATRLVRSGVDVPNMILSHATEGSIDLIVMGGYGHSRLRELVLGGATRGILTSMTVPVLISH